MIHLQIQMKLRILIFIFILFGFIAALAQQDPIDSLKKLLNGKQDTLNAHNLIEVAFEYDQVSALDSEIVYAKKALALSEHLNYTKGIARSHYRLGVAYCN